MPTGDLTTPLCHLRKPENDDPLQKKLKDQIDYKVTTKALRESRGIALLYL
jgi:hypothetical protein